MMTLSHSNSINVLMVMALNPNKGLDAMTLMYMCGLDDTSTARHILKVLDELGLIQYTGSRYESKNRKPYKITQAGFNYLCA